MAASSRPPILTLVSLATFLKALCNFLTIFCGPVDVVLLVLFLVGRQTNLLRPLLDATALRNACGLAAGICLLSFLVAQSVRSVRARPHTKQWDGPGKVLLFPCQTSHARKFPQKHSFTYSYVTVGIPVGFAGNAGGMVSVEAASTPGFPSWLSLTSPSAWFTVDAGDYLERGNSELRLRGKLDAYLRSQGAQPEHYPHAYLLTAPRFFGYHFNPVSFWYLYDAGRRLAGMILEVNNTFDERRMYFLTENAPEEQLKEDNPPQHIFKHAWPKDFHVSPFSSRKGSYTLTITDPLSGTTPPRIAITLHSSKSHPKLFASLTPTSAAIDPTTLTALQKLRFLAAWWWVGFLTHPRILREAGRLFFRRGLRVWYRPEPLSGTISRRATATERRLEAIFRRFLQHLVEGAEKPLVVRYIPAGLPTEEVVLHSPAATKLDTEINHLEIRILTPAFYANFAAASDSHSTFINEHTTARTVAISRPDLLENLFPKAQPPAPTFAEETLFGVIQLLRQQPDTTATGEPSMIEGAVQPAVGLSQLDGYVLAHESGRARAEYKGFVLKMVLADRFTFGMVGVVEGVLLVLRVGVAWVVAGGLGGVVSVLVS